MNTTHQHKTSLTLLSRIRENDSDGWIRFVQLYGPLVYGWARNSGLQAADAADVTQEVFAVIQQKISSFDPERKANGAFRSWLWGITRLQMLDHFRSGRGRVPTVQPQHLNYPAVGPEITESEPDSVGGQSVRDVLISTAIRIVKSESKSNSWDAFWRMAVYGHSAVEIAADQGTNARAVRQAKFRVTKKLRALLSEVAPEFDDEFDKLKECDTFLK